MIYFYNRNGETTVNGNVKIIAKKIDWNVLKIESGQ